MPTRLLLDEMLSGVIADQLRNRGHDVVAVVDDPAMTGLSDDEVLAVAVLAQRAVVTANIRDFIALDQRHRAVGRSHPGIVLVSSTTFRQDRSFVGSLVGALDKLLGVPVSRANTVTFLQP